MQASSLCTSKVALSLPEGRNYKFPKYAKKKSSDLDAIERHSGKNKNTVHEKKTSFGKAEKKSHFLPFFSLGSRIPLFFAHIPETRSSSRRRRREQRRIRNGHHHREIPRHRDHRWGRTSPFVAVFPSLYSWDVLLRTRGVLASPFSSSIQGGQ